MKLEFSHTMKTGIFPTTFSDSGFLNPYMLHSQRNQSTDLHCKSMDWFLYECNIDLMPVKILRYISIVTKIKW